MSSRISSPKNRVLAKRRSPYTDIRLLRSNGRNGSGPAVRCTVQACCSAIGGNRPQSVIRCIVPPSATKKRAPTTPRVNGRPYSSCTVQRPHSNLRRTSWTFCLTNSYPRRRGWSTCNQRFADCGYRSASRFTDSFHERFGLPPSEFCSSMSDNEPDLGVGGHRLPRPCTVVRTTLFHSGGNYV